jgi:hypothetical protein
MRVVALDPFVQKCEIDELVSCIMAQGLDDRAYGLTLNLSLKSKLVVAVCAM